MANILYLGNSDHASTSYHRATALQRLGHKVTIHDTHNILHKPVLSKYLEPLHFRTGYRFFQPTMVKWIDRMVKSTAKPDLIWVNGGELLGRECVQLLKKLDCPMVLYNNDDPTGTRDGGRFKSLLPTLPYYDLCAVMREVNVNEFKAKGAKKVVRVFMSYDEVAHCPFEDVSDIPPNYRSSIVFIGTWMRNERRDAFLLELVRHGLPLSIYGDRWTKSPYWKELQFAYKGGSLSGRDYVAAIQGAKICLGLLSKGNRDLHTQRSLEVPYAGGLFCAERTIEHLQMYEEGAEAVFWSDAKECMEVCEHLLENDDLRESIRLRGMQKVRANSAGNEDVCRRILREVQLGESKMALIS